VSPDRVAQDLNGTQMRQIVTALNQGRYDEEIGGLGSYQLAHQAVAIPGDTPHSVEVITGLPRASVEAQITTLFSMIALTTIGGLILLALSTAITIRLALRPLREVAATANRVANQPLDRGDVSITERVPAAEADPRTETGLVGAALNTLLDHVDASLAVRQRNEERMRQFVADASHELRTPLSSIRGYSELSLRALSTSTAPEDPATASAHTALERIQAQSLRMTRLVEDLLLLARLEEGRELSLSTVDLSRLAIEGVEDARPTAPDHVWTIDVPAEPVELIGDTGRLQQVVANLVANARTHTPAGTRITVEVAVDGEDAVLRVRDDGPGIDPQVRDELFSRFARGDRSRNRATGGSGLGLSITKAIVEGHGGTISVQSEPGETVFTVRLPRMPHAASAPDDDRAAEGGHEIGRAIGGR
jgi:two-component system OmpR family sensor kinase